MPSGKEMMTMYQQAVMLEANEGRDGVMQSALEMAGYTVHRMGSFPTTKEPYVAVAEPQDMLLAWGTDAHIVKIDPLGGPGYEEMAAYVGAGRLDQDYGKHLLGQITPGEVEQAIDHAKATVACLDNVLTSDGHESPVQKAI
ncbi:hypothetical protein ACFL0V_03065 [Nanoarchaeota archaeon]